GCARFLIGCMPQPHLPAGADSARDDTVTSGTVSFIRHSSHVLRPSKPRTARLRMSADIPDFHGGAFSQVVTLFSRVPSLSLKTRTTPAVLCVKPLPGASRSSTGANIVPRNRTKPSGY